MQILNIGLHGPDGPIAPAAVAFALRAVGADIDCVVIRQSDTEPTLVAALKNRLLPFTIHALAAQLKQEAIAAWDGTRGRLIGPKASAWGQFDGRYFLMPDGSRLAADKAA